MPIPNDRKYTADEFFELETDENERYELIDGEIVALATPTELHQDIAGGLYSELRAYIRNKGGKCKAMISPFAVKLDDKNVVEPDVFVVCDPNKRDGKRINGAPDFVVEVVSSNRKYDFVEKYEKYATSGVREYWIVDPKNKRTVVYWFEDEYIINIYTFDQPIPVGIYDGELNITIADII